MEQYCVTYDSAKESCTTYIYRGCQCTSYALHYSIGVWCESWNCTEIVQNTTETCGNKIREIEIHTDSFSSKFHVAFAVIFFLAGETLLIVKCFEAPDKGNEIRK
jgi:hypothetical protein